MNYGPTNVKVPKNASKFPSTVNYIEKCFKQKLQGIKFLTKNSVDTYLYQPQEWSWGALQICIFEIIHFPNVR